jgi:hypothetical protein
MKPDASWRPIHLLWFEEDVREIVVQCQTSRFKEEKLVKQGEPDIRRSRTVNDLAAKEQIST